MKNEIYISCDVEADGKIPGQSSMLSFGAAAYSLPKTLVSTFAANLELLPEATPDPETMSWWQTQPDAWKACRTNLEDPKAAMTRFVDWIRKLPGQPVFVGYPVAYDFMWVYWYLIRYVGQSPFSHSALDMKTLAMALLKKPYRQSTKKSIPKSWFDDLPHTHQALDDAIEQGALLCNMMARLKSTERGQ